MAKGINKKKKEAPIKVMKTLSEQMKDIDRQWSTIKRGEQLKKLLFKYTIEYREAGEALRKDVGVQDALNQTVLGMKSLYGGNTCTSVNNNNNNNNNNKSSIACAKLSKLVKLTNILLNKEGVPFKLVGDTKRIAFREPDAIISILTTTTTTTTATNNNTATNRAPITPGLVETPNSLI